MQRNHLTATFDIDRDLWFTNHDGEIVTSEYAYKRIMSGWSWINRTLVPVEKRKAIADTLANNTWNRGTLVSYLVHEANVIAETR